MSASPPPPERKRPRESDDEEGDGSVSAKRVAKLEGDVRLVRHNWERMFLFFDQAVWSVECLELLLVAV